MSLSLGSIDIKSWSLGGCYVREAYLGSIQIWPAAGITTAVTNARVVYSEGNMLNAAGTNYAEIKGVLHYYSGGTEIDADSGFTFYVSALTSSNEFIQNGMTVTTPNLGTTVQSQRTETWYGYVNPGNLTASVNITREANQLVTTSGAGQFNYVATVGGDSGLTQIGFNSYSTYLTGQLTRRNIYTSSAYTEYVVSPLKDYVSARTDSGWITLEQSSSYPVLFSVSNYTQPGSTRVGHIELYDKDYNNVVGVFTIVQGVPIWIIAPPAQFEIDYDTTGFTIPVVSSCSGNPYPITEEMISFSGNSMGLFIEDIEYVSGTTYNVTFSCDENTGSTIKNTTIIFTQPHGRAQSTAVEQQSANVPYEKQYLTFNILSNGAIIWRTNNASFVKTIVYKKNDDTSWTPLVPTTAGTSISVVAGDKVLFKGNNENYGDRNAFSYCSFGNTTAQHTVCGNIMSLIYGDNFVSANTLNSGSTFYYLFASYTSARNKLLSAKDLILPATTLAAHCYDTMFDNRSSMVEVPALPATTLAYQCYNSMFFRCTSLTTAPALPATTLADQCYQSMFRLCTSLTTAPELPATTLAHQCYASMFDGCTSLTTAPELPATTLASHCYQGMFNNCTNLVNAPELPVMALTWDGEYNSMFSYCTSLTTAPELPATAVSLYTYEYMFQGCTSLVNAPSVLPATELWQSSYESMFEGCTSLTTAPELPAAVLTYAYYGYRNMFKDCSSLNYIKCLATDTSGAYDNWVQGVAATGTFVKKAGITWPSGNSGIPDGWTVQEVS